MTNVASNTRVLVAEDEPSLAKLFEYILNKKGCEVEVVTTGDQASERLTQTTYDMVVLDQMMPGRTGEAVWRGLREYSQVPVLLMSARDLEQGFAAEFAADPHAKFMRKPFDPERFVRQVDQMTAVPDDWTQILAEFVASLPGRLESLKKAQNFEQVKAVAHRLAGIAGSYGFPKLGELAFQLEACGGFGHAALLMDALHKVINEQSDIAIVPEIR